MNRYILHIQKHTLLHSWTLDVTDGSTTHKDAWMLSFDTHLMYVLYNILKILKSPLSGATASRGSGPPHYHGFTIVLICTIFSQDSSRWMTGPMQRPDNTQHSQETDIHARGGIRTHNPSKPTAADPRLRPRGHWDRSKFLNTVSICTWLVGQYWYIWLLCRTINSFYVR
jgi:hypothetical protein